MSEAAATHASMDEALEKLTGLAENTTTTGALTFLERCNTMAVALTRRPGDVDRCAWALYQLTTEIAYLRNRKAVNS